MGDDCMSFIDANGPRELAQKVDEFPPPLFLLPFRQRFELLDTLLQAVPQFDLATAQPAEEPVIVIPDNAQRITASTEPLDEPKGGNDLVPPVDNVADEDDAWKLPFARRRNGRIEESPVPERFQQFGKLVVTAMDIADDVAAGYAEMVVNSRMPGNGLMIELVGRLHP
jgi:hypothetical protein